MAPKMSLGVKLMTLQSQDRAPGPRITAWRRGTQPRLLPLNSNTSERETPVVLNH